MFLIFMSIYCLEQHCLIGPSTGKRALMLFVLDTHFEWECDCREDSVLKPPWNLTSKTS